MGFVDKKREESGQRNNIRERMKEIQFDFGKSPRESKEEKVVFEESNMSSYQNYMNCGIKGKGVKAD